MHKATPKKTFINVRLNQSYLPFHPVQVFHQTHCCVNVYHAVHSVADVVRHDSRGVLRRCSRGSRRLEHLNIERFQDSVWQTI